MAIVYDDRTGWVSGKSIQQTGKQHTYPTPTAWMEEKRDTDSTPIPSKPKM